MSRKMIDYKVEDGTITSIDGYEVGGGGTAVEANPQEEATQQLNKIKIDNITYSTGGGGTNNYDDLTNKPKLSGFLKSVELSGTTNIKKILPIGVDQNSNLLVIGGNSSNVLNMTYNGNFSGGAFLTSDGRLRIDRYLDMGLNFIMFSNGKIAYFDGSRPSDAPDGSISFG